MEYKHRSFWDIKVTTEIVNVVQNGTTYIRQITIKEGIQHVNYLPI